MNCSSEPGVIAAGAEPRTCRANVASPPRIAPPLLAATALLAMAAPAQAQTTTVTQSGAGATWSLVGENTVAAGQTYTYTLTRTSGSLPLNEYLGFTSDTLEAERFQDGTSDCTGTNYFCFTISDSEFYQEYTVSNVRFAGRILTDTSPHVLTLKVATGTPTGTTVTLGVVRRSGVPRSGGLLITVGTATTNTAPTAADKTVTTGEDRAYAFTADDVVTTAQIDGDMLTFTPARDAHCDPYTTFTFTVNDGTDDSASAYTMTIDVTDAPAPVCGVPNFGTRRNIWTGMVTVERIERFGEVFYGFDEVLSAGTLLPSQSFSIGSNNYVIEAIVVVTLSGNLNFSLDGLDQLTDRENAALRLHVCDGDYDFNTASASDRTNTVWTTTLDWSDPVTTRTVYLSLPANNAGDGRVYGDGDGRSHHHEPGGVGGVDIRHLADADTGRGAGCGRDGDAGVRAAGVEPGAGRGGQRCAGVQRPEGQRRGGQHRADGRTDHHGHGAGGPDADGGHHRHRGRQRADQPRIHVPVDPGERHGGRHCGREFEHLHPGRRRQEENQ